MFRFRGLALSLAAWSIVWVFWLMTTRDFHPTLALALVATTSLITAYASAAYINHLVLIPLLLSKGLHWQYAVWLAATMAVLTAIALAVIRVTYNSWWGSDADPFGIYKHYAIDLFGMAVHLLAAAATVKLTDWLCCRSRAGRHL